VGCGSEVGDLFIGLLCCYNVYTSKIEHLSHRPTPPQPTPSNQPPQPTPRTHTTKRLRERDDSKTKKVVEEETRESRKDRERRAAAGLAGEDRAALVPLLRDVSRQEYLARREADKLAALEDEIKDEEFLFSGGWGGGGSAW